MTTAPAKMLCSCCGEVQRVSWNFATDEVTCYTCGLVDCVGAFAAPIQDANILDIPRRGEYKLWLDDIRDPKDYGLFGWVWVKTADQAIEFMSQTDIVEASLDHDLSENAQHGNPADGEKTGYTVLCWMEENNFWPKRGVRIHTMNPSGGARMLAVVQKHYGVKGNESFGPPPRIKLVPKMANTQFKPLHDQILIQPNVAAKMSDGGLHIPAAAQRQEGALIFGTVLAVGPGEYDKFGVRVPLETRPGDKVLYYRNPSTEIEVDGVDGKCVVIHEGQYAVAVVEQ